VVTKDRCLTSKLSETCSRNESGITVHKMNGSVGDIMLYASAAKDIMIDEDREGRTDDKPSLPGVFLGRFCDKTPVKLCESAGQKARTDKCKK